MIRSRLGHHEPDKKEYEYTVLPCDLEVLLVSTSKVHLEGSKSGLVLKLLVVIQILENMLGSKAETSQKSAAALSVQVGSFADPNVAGS